MRPLFVFSTVFVCLVSLNGCAPYGQHSDRRYADNTAPIHHYSPPRRARDHEGRVSGIERLSAPSSGGGAIVGAVLGGVLGNQLGHGRGRSAATGVGVIGGALVGNEVEKNGHQSQGGYRVTVDFDDGQRAQFDYQDVGDLQIGDRIIEEHGQLNRL